MFSRRVEITLKLTKLYECLKLNVPRAVVLTNMHLYIRICKALHNTTSVNLSSTEVVRDGGCWCRCFGPYPCRLKRWEE